MECEADYCGSRIFRVGEDGFTYCSEGHRQLHTGLVLAEDDGVLPTGRKTIRKQQDDAVLLSGRFAIEHYLVCFQTVLWTQIHQLVHQHALPERLASIVRDLWTVRLSSLQSRLPANDTHIETTSQLFSSQGADSDTDARSTRTTSTQEHPLPNLADAITWLYMAMLTLRLPIMLKDVFDMIQDGQVLYYRALQSLDSAMKARLPGVYRDALLPARQLSFARFSRDTTQKIAEYEHRHGVVVPALNHHLVLWRLVRGMALPLETYNGTLRLAQLLELDFSFSRARERQGRQRTDLSTPERRLIAALIVTTKLFYPIDNHERPPHKATEPATLVMDWAAWAASMNADDDTNDHDDEDDTNDSTDGDHSRNGPHSSGTRRSTFRRGLDTTEDDVITMSAAQMDEYMSWFAELYTTDQIPERATRRGRQQDTFMSVLHGFFPLSDDLDMKVRARPGLDAQRSGSEEQRLLKARRIDERLLQGQRRMKPVRVLAPRGNDEDLDRPGSRYMRYRTIDDLGSGPVRALYAEAAKWTALDIIDVVHGVWTLETKLEAVMADKH